jgi:hypothetical protein
MKERLRTYPRLQSVIAGKRGYLSNGGTWHDLAHAQPDCRMDEMVINAWTKDFTLDLTDVTGKRRWHCWQ